MVCLFSNSPMLFIGCLIKIWYACHSQNDQKRCCNMGLSGVSPGHLGSGMCHWWLGTMCYQIINRHDIDCENFSLDFCSRYLISTHVPFQSWFYPQPVLAFRYCRCQRLSVHVSVSMSICLSVNPELVCAIICDPFEPGSPNLDQRWKAPWLRSVLL